MVLAAAVVYLFHLITFQSKCHGLLFFSLNEFFIFVPTFPLGRMEGDCVYCVTSLLPHAKR